MQLLVCTRRHGVNRPHSLNIVVCCSVTGPSAPTENEDGDEAKVAGEEEEDFDSATISTSITPAVWDCVMKATAPAMDDRALKLERTKRKRKLAESRKKREQLSQGLEAQLDKSLAQVGRSLRVIKLEAFHEMMKEVEGEGYFPSRVRLVRGSSVDHVSPTLLTLRFMAWPQVTSIFEDARAVFEQARWDR